ncbi:hypothetical protein [Companilactobacillus kimchiensis]|uniref:XRE family transcriptional regulator n=1 Tax=Companilactobacillus kimchiensis TaxID=993692 RepID=A0A0R2LDW7_9LACO|nr:hypothetical protein [Companilactobacillus kimchiensis]KRN99723.1 XRE family transcriptional regulator [Companilactobacillus kimchiensis]
MTINSEFSKIFEDSGLNRQELTQKLGVSEQEVMMLQAGTLYPNDKLRQSIYDLVPEKRSLRKFESKFETGQLVGNKVSFTRTAFTIVFIIFISALFTGFGYQPMWVLSLVLVLGIGLTLPACFHSYWIIKNDRIETDDFNQYDFIKIFQLLGLVSKKQATYKYDQIKKASLEYKLHTRISPFDIQADYFRINLTLQNNEIISLGIDSKLATDLSDFISLLNHQGINVSDQQQVLQVIDHGENLFEHFNASLN